VNLSRISVDNRKMDPQEIKQGSKTDRKGGAAPPLMNSHPRKGMGEQTWGGRKESTAKDPNGRGNLEKGGIQENPS